MSEFDPEQVYWQGEQALAEYTNLLAQRGATFGPYQVPVQHPSHAVLYLHEANQRAAAGEQVFDSEQAEVLSHTLPTPQATAYVENLLQSGEMQQQGLVGYPHAEAFVGQVLEGTQQATTQHVEDLTYDPNSRIARALNGEPEERPQSHLAERLSGGQQQDFHALLNEHTPQDGPGGQSRLAERLSGGQRQDIEALINGTSDERPQPFGPGPNPQGGRNQPTAQDRGRRAAERPTESRPSKDTPQRPQQHER